ncbi:MAG: hypothetical protein HFI30_00920 [Lachnospiraceae bacterium]|jgi:hypothetical protein|nr:hypothetical protein [Lachnospiraceae bacterium]
MNHYQYIPIREITCTQGEGPLLHLQYFLTCLDRGNKADTLYGIRVRKYTEDQTLAEESDTPPISYSEAFVRQLLQHLIHNAVTPMCLLEVLDELISAA